jgi:ergothioneine biosynthesis protein EgtB
MSIPLTADPALSGTAIRAWFDETRARSRGLFDLIDRSAYYERPIALRNPIVFYEGHLPAFNVNVLVKKALGRRGVDSTLEVLFERGIDPEAPPDQRALTWPARERVQRYAEDADDAVREVLSGLGSTTLVDDSRLRGAVFTIVEHELMHQETLLYMFHRLPPGQKQRPAGVVLAVDGNPPQRTLVSVPAGVATLGARADRVSFGWDNEFDEHAVHVSAFEIETHDVTNADFLAFVEAGGYEDARLWTDERWRWIREHGVRHPVFWERHDGRWYWRAMFDVIPLPPAWPVYVSHAEASAYARWRGMRLPTEAEFHRAAFGTPDGPERAYPWGDDEPDARHGVFDFSAWDPAPVGSSPAGRSAWGVHDLTGNGWEWTDTVFAPFPGFDRMWTYPAYSADFFDGRHYVMKGGSPVTAAPLLRRSFRNWFRPQYPYVYATFRCVRGTERDR